MSSTRPFLHLISSLIFVCYHFSGWENYLSKEKVKVRKVISNDERLFSLSSVTSPASRNEERKKTAHSSGKSRTRKPSIKKKNKESVSGSPSQANSADAEQSAQMEDEQELGDI